MRYKIVFAIFFVFWMVLVGRLYYISVQSNLYYEKLAKANTFKTIPIVPIRGEIFDTNGKLLAMNQIGFSISIKPHLKKDSSELTQAIQALHNAFNDLNQTVMHNVYTKKNSPYNHKFIKVADFIPYKDMIGVYPHLSLNENILIEAEAKRYYPYGKYVAHVIGYIGHSNQEENAQDTTVKEVGRIGKSSLEKQYNTHLQGELGANVVKVTATNKEVEIIQTIPAKENRNLNLFLDIELQKMIYDRFGKSAGAVVVMKTTGEVLAAVSTPSYDPNIFTTGISHAQWKELQEDFDRPFTNKFLNGQYPPGSSIKMGMALAFEMAKPGILNRNEYCKGHIEVGATNHKFRCWKSRGHGSVDLRKAIRESCDVYFYNKSLEVGINNMAKGLRLMGLGVPTGIDLPHESVGIVPDIEWKMKRYKKSWYLGETVNASIGQGYTLSTPLQMARHTALIATSSLPTPLLADIHQQHIEKISLPEEFLPEARKGMYDVCNTPGGTAYNYMRNLPIVVAGKTGTSQVVGIPKDVKVRMKEEEMDYYHRSHAWLTTYAPYEKPKIVVTVLVEHGGHGGSAAGPIAADIYKWLHKNGYFDSK
ncbi:MAG TPA: penicillin-binding protein 2 [Epsilonproteobacteria bacterium]|nr:penicillin-binding protein 2 [Campylobacterota bacterium]